MTAANCLFACPIRLTRVSRESRSGRKDSCVLTDRAIARGDRKSNDHPAASLRNRRAMPVAVISASRRTRSGPKMDNDGGSCTGNAFPRWRTARDRYEALGARVTRVRNRVRARTHAPYVRHSRAAHYVDNELIWRGTRMRKKEISPLSITSALESFRKSSFPERERERERERRA